jgi:cell division protein FtsW (lipid II flippase)
MMSYSAWRTTTSAALLIISSVFLVINWLSLGLIRNDFSHSAHGLVWFLCAVGGIGLLRRYLPHHDPLIFPLVMLLSGWGLVVIDRLAPVFADRQAVWLIVSVVAMLIAALFPQPLEWLRRYRYTLLIVGLALLLATILLGRNPSDPERLTNAPALWLGAGTIFFQPSEALKIILVAFIASYLAEQYPAQRAVELTGRARSAPSGRILGPMLLMWGICVVILIWQRDLGTAILFFIVFLMLLYVATSYHRILVLGSLLVLLAGLVGYQAFSVVQLRVDIWLNPWPEADGRAYQIVQSLLAFAAGGPFGQGVGQGSPGYIPVVHSDFAIAALAEEWGLIGVLGVIACLSVVILRGLRSAAQPNRRPFHALLAVGLSTMLGAQSLLIMAGALKLVPLTGVTLPFLSYGGSSLLASFIMIGLLLRISAQESG